MYGYELYVSKPIKYFELELELDSATLMNSYSLKGVSQDFNKI